MQDHQTHATLYQARFGVVETLLKAGRLDEALQRMETLVDQNPGYSEAHNDLAVIYHQAGRLRDAQHSIQRAAALAPNSPTVIENARMIAAAIAASVGSGQATAGAVSPPRAAASYDDCLTTVESMVTAGQSAAAITLIEDFVATHPTHGEAWNDIAALQHSRGNLESALIAAGIALEIDDKNPLFRHTRATILLDMGQLDEAVRVIDPVLRENPRDVDALILVGDISLAFGSAADARPFYQNAIAIDPTCARAAVKLATVEAPEPSRAAL